MAVPSIDASAHQHLVFKCTQIFKHLYFTRQSSNTFYVWWDFQSLLTAKCPQSVQTVGESRSLLGEAIIIILYYNYITITITNITIIRWFTHAVGLLSILSFDPRVAGGLALKMFQINSFWILIMSMPSVIIKLKLKAYDRSSKYRNRYLISVISRCQRYLYSLYIIAGYSCRCVPVSLEPTT